MPADRGGPGELDGSSPHLEVIRPASRVPLGFVREGSTIVLIARDRSARWPTDLLRDRAAELDVSGVRVRGSPEMVTDPDEKVRLGELFRAKYGDADFARWYDRPARVLRVQLGTGPPPGGPEDGYRSWLTAEFDNVATDYDHHITGNRVNRLLRDRSLAELRRVFRGRRSLLEIGCGSGMETLPLLLDGHELTCVDLSERMLEVVRAKARAAGVAEALRTVHGTAGELGSLLTDVGAGAFDGAYSTYGAMNCEAHLDRVPPALGHLLRPTSPFVAGVYNRWCLFELVGYGITGRWARALGRSRSPVPVGASRFCVDVFAYSLPDFRRRFRPWFQLRRVEAVPVVVPPSDLAVYADRFERGWSTWTRVDRAVARTWPLAALGDHFLATFERRRTSGDGAG